MYIYTHYTVIQCIYNRYSMYWLFSFVRCVTRSLILVYILLQWWYFMYTHDGAALRQLYLFTSIWCVFVRIILVPLLFLLALKWFCGFISCWVIWQTHFFLLFHSIIGWLSFLAIFLQQTSRVNKKRLQECFSFGDHVETCRNRTLSFLRRNSYKTLKWTNLRSHTCSFDPNNWNLSYQYVNYFQRNRQDITPMVWYYKNPRGTLVVDAV